MFKVNDNSWTNDKEPYYAELMSKIEWDDASSRKKYEFKTDSETLADDDEMNTTAQSGLIENLWTR